MNLHQQTLQMANKVEAAKPITKSFVDMVEDKEKKAKAIVKIQAHWRGYKTRKDVYSMIKS